jgi:tRNA(Arg) A34 adenosine deaminase TadA
MMHAINLAKIAFQKSEVPVGAIIVKNGKLLGRVLIKL